MSATILTMIPIFNRLSSLYSKPWKSVDCITRTICELDIASSLLPGIVFSDSVNSTVTSLAVLQTKLILKVRAMNTDDANA